MLKFPELGAGMWLTAWLTSSVQKNHPQYKKTMSCKVKKIHRFREHWAGNPWRAVLEEESWRRNPGGRMFEKNPEGEILEKEHWRRNYGGGIVQ